MGLIVSTKESPYGSMAIVTDRDLIGKLFEEGKVQLDLRKDFFKGEEKNKEEVKKIIISSRHIFLTGKEAVAVAIEMDLIEGKRIFWVKGIPHAQIVLE